MIVTPDTVNPPPDQPMLARPGGWISRQFPPGPTRRQRQTWGNVWWRVCVSRLPHTDPFFDAERDAGAASVVPVMRFEPFPPAFVTVTGVQHLLFAFPERYLRERQVPGFVLRLKDHPQVRQARLNVIDIVTGSSRLVWNLNRDDYRVFDPKPE